ncbi:hypothetical protein EJ06DRAFT_251102 [Trichodelitschia bisporula]|uniref:Uncharacterized protein n=1 Tax=Trichodelitschia bisporula TaxID=703511 RepID=A0A6G1HIR5_9PEZI|nr:hypothetical protein EJ06DRAFT_251102 [Trichodelitschia bisporula]
MWNIDDKDGILGTSYLMMSFYIFRGCSRLWTFLRWKQISATGDRNLIFLREWKAVLRIRWRDVFRRSVIRDALCVVRRAERVVMEEIDNNRRERPIDGTPGRVFRRQTGYYPLSQEFLAIVKVSTTVRGGGGGVLAARWATQACLYICRWRMRTRWCNSCAAGAKRRNLPPNPPPPFVLFSTSHQLPLILHLHLHLHLQPSRQQNYQQLHKYPQRTNHTPMLSKVLIICKSKKLVENSP